MGNRQKRKKRGLKKLYKQRGYNTTKSRKFSNYSNTEENCHNTNIEVGDPGALDKKLSESTSIKSSLPVSTLERHESSVEQIEDCSFPCNGNAGENIPKNNSLPASTSEDYESTVKKIENCSSPCNGNAGESIPKDNSLPASTSERNDSPVEQIEDNSAPYDIEKTKSSPQACQLDGRRIVNLKTFYPKLQEVATHGPLDCGLGSVEIVSEIQNGYHSTFTLQCKLCNIKFYINSDEGSEMDINNCAVLGTLAIGCGHSQLQELSAALDLPIISPKTYQKCHENIGNMWDKISVKTMNDAAKEERELAVKEGRVDENRVPIIDVIVDGCWSKRTYKKNYSALSGAAAIIGKKSGKVLYLGIKNKYCCICAQAENKNETSIEHKCFKNYTGPSTGMESAILVEGFKCSIPMHGLIYGRMISDGDSATYSKIIETRPYLNTTVQKIECKNHIMRNLCNKLTQLKTDTKYPVRFRKNITDQKIIAIRSSIKKSIEKHTSDSESEKRAHVELLYSDIMQAHLHAFGDHSGCKSYFCNKISKDKANSIKDNDDIGFRNSTLWSRICQIMSNVASHAPSLIHNVESNKVENFNSIIAKLVGGKRINFSLRGSYQNRCKGAAISYNTHTLLSTTYKHATGKSPRKKMRLLEHRRLKKGSSRKLFKKRCTTFKSRSMAAKGEDLYYGENCAKEDIIPEIMEKQKTTYLNDLHKSKEERDFIERETVLQSSCGEWLELRRRLLTASNFGRVIKRRPNISCSNLVKDLLYKDSISHVKSIKHGADNEKIAIEQMSKETGLIIQPCGLFIDDNLPYLGATPDGICDDMTVEVKCPASAYEQDFLESVKNKKILFYKINKNGCITINTNHNWYFQIQGQLHITKKAKCLFGLWLSEKTPMRTDIIERDDEFWSKVMEDKLKNFYLDCILPELIDPRHPRRMEIRNPSYIEKAIEEKTNRKEYFKKRNNNKVIQNDVEGKDKINIEKTKACEKNTHTHMDTKDDKSIDGEKNEKEGEDKENKETDYICLPDFPKITVLKYGEISDDEEIQPAKRRKILYEKKLNFSEF